MVQQSAALEHFDTTVIARMSADEARECVNRINTHMNSARAELLRLYEGRGWESLGYPSRRACVTTESDARKTHLYRQLEAAQIEQRISPIGEIGAIPEGQIRPLAALTPMEQPIAWQEANDRTNGKPTAKAVEQVVKEMRGEPTIAEIALDIDDVLDPPMEASHVADMQRATRMNAGMYSSDTPEWYTPNRIIKQVVAALDHIDLDPCSNSKTDPNVPAREHFTIDDDGLNQLWYGKVYMNPPYGDEISDWVERIIGAYESGEIDEAIALLPSRTGSAWFQPLFAYPICFVRGRLRFSGSKNSAPFDSAVVYFGSNVQRFESAFADIGRIK